MENIFFGAELLAPCGGMESLIAALRCGADAVYLGGKRFSARGGAENFDDDELSRAVALCHLYSAKVYLAVNTLVSDGELSELSAAVCHAGRIGVDGLIVQDIGATHIIRNMMPKMPLHASTQMTIHTRYGALFAGEIGFCRVVAAREMSEGEISKLSAAGVEVEAFVHGAECMSISGQCYMSAIIGRRSANRGLCAGSCRLPAAARGLRGERYDLSLKDMSLLDMLKRLRLAGVSSFKIEGRLKRPEYVAAAVSAYRQAMDGSVDENSRAALRAVFSRSGFTDGYFCGKPSPDMFGVRSREDVTAAAAVLPRLRSLYEKERKIYDISFKLTLKRGESARLTATSRKAGGITVSAVGAVPQEAISRPTDSAAAEKQLSRLGDTVYTPKSIDCDIDDGIMLPVSELNRLRREAVEMLNSAIIEKNTIVKSAAEYPLYFPKLMNIKHRAIRARIRKREQLDGVSDFVEYVIIPIEECYNIPPETAERIIISPPAYTTDEAAVTDRLRELFSAGFRRLYCRNPAHLKIGREIGFILHGGHELNIFNSYSLKALAEYGAADAVVSFELRLTAVAELADYLPYGIIAHGRLPLMLTRNCPLKNAGGCKDCTDKNRFISDRTGRRFPIRCDGRVSEVLNSDILYLADKLSDIRGVSFIELLFDDESPEEISAVCREYERGSNAAPEGVTRGLYYRGVL